MSGSADGGWRNQAWYLGVPDHRAHGVHCRWYPWGPGQRWHSQHPTQQFRGVGALCLRAWVEPSCRRELEGNVDPLHSACSPYCANPSPPGIPSVRRSRLHVHLTIMHVTCESGLSAVAGVEAERWGREGKLGRPISGPQLPACLSRWKTTEPRWLQ